MPFNGSCFGVLIHAALVKKFGIVSLFQELGMRNPYHRKKLVLAAEATASGVPSVAANIDHNWVISEWTLFMDLYQYKLLCW